MANRIKSTISIVNERVGGGFSFLVLVFCFVIVVEVIGRFAFDNPTIWAHETSKLLFGIYIVFGGGYTLLKESHIRVDILWQRLSSRGAAIADLATSGFGFLFMGVLLWFTVRMAWHSVLIKESSISVFGPPLYPSKICLAIGVVLLFLQMIVKFADNLHIVREGRR